MALDNTKRTDFCEPDCACAKSGRGVICLKVLPAVLEWRRAPIVDLGDAIAALNDLWTEFPPYQMVRVLIAAARGHERAQLDNQFNMIERAAEGLLSVKALNAMVDVSDYNLALRARRN